MNNLLQIMDISRFQFLISMFITFELIGLILIIIGAIINVKMGYKWYRTSVDDDDGYIIMSGSGFVTGGIIFILFPVVISLFVLMIIIIKNLVY